VFTGGIGIEGQFKGETNHLSNLGVFQKKGGAESGKLAKILIGKIDPLN